MTETLLLAALILIAALLYSTVGHGGASGYLAAMALFNIVPEKMKPTALVLNVLVSTVGTFRFSRAGHFSWNVFAAFALLSIPAAFIGGAMRLPVQVYKVILGLVLLFAAWRLAFKVSALAGGTTKPVKLPLAFVLGAAIGLLSGMIGVGGGIFLSPLILLLGWATPHQTAGISAAFILVNSVAGLLGHWTSVRALPGEIVWWAPAAFLGGIIGAELGSRHLTPLMLRRMLAAVLVVAGLKMLLGR